MNIDNVDIDENNEINTGEINDTNEAFTNGKTKMRDKVNNKINIENIYKGIIDNISIK